jgi:hypothetical protein
MVRLEEGGAMRIWGLVAIVALTTVIATASAARADVIHLMNGNTIQVDAWRDAGDAVEFARGGGIIRIPKSDISRIEGSTQSKDLRMYSAPASATAVPTANNAPAAIKEMSAVLTEGAALFGQTSLDAQAKASAFRRLGDRWRALEVPSDLLDLYSRASRALQMSADAYDEDSQGVSADSKERIEAAQKAVAEVKAEVDQQSKES